MKGKIVYLILIVLSFCACQEDRVENENGEGWLAIEFLTDKSVRTRATEPEYQLRITNSQGKEVAHYDNFKGLSDRILLPAGTYTLVATSGEDVVADFEKPYYKAEQEVNIEAAVTKQVSLICTQANVKVTVEYSDLIKSHFPEYTLKVVNGEGSLTFIKDEKRSGYLRVNEGTLVWHLTLNNGQEVFRLNSQREKLNDAREYQTNYMWQEYELTLHAAMDLRDDTYDDLSTLKKMIAQIRDEIRKLGDVNVNAIEDYKEISERYQFLKTQHDDLIEAEKTLIGIIEELDTGMRKQFMEKFAEIQKQFDTVFKELFGGGKGTLELVEDEDILECGIRIIAQPPGKKLQNMMQMSGGEKSLTAISLLFAIQNLKPSPFCLLDEIEAALDDSNVGRYANYLHKLTKHTQFIVITHRRGTMSAADRLYGITMQEKGVSTLVSVDLIENDLNDRKKES